MLIMGDKLKTIDRNLCPICNRNNNCSSFSADSTTQCWCAKENFPQEIFNLVPREQLRKSCICRSCFVEFER